MNSCIHLRSLRFNNSENITVSGIVNLLTARPNMEQLYIGSTGIKLSLQDILLISAAGRNLIILGWRPRATPLTEDELLGIVLNCPKLRTLKIAGILQSRLTDNADLRNLLTYARHCRAFNKAPSNSTFNLSLSLKRRLDEALISDISQNNI